MLHLHLHHKSKGYQHHRYNILEDNEELAEQHPASSGIGPPDNVNRLCPGRLQGRQQPCKGSKHKNSQHISRHIFEIQDKPQSDNLLPILIIP